MRQRSGDTDTEILPGAPYVFSMADPFESERSGPAVDWMGLYLPRDAVPELEAALGAAANGRLHGPMARVLHDLLDGLAERLPDLSAAEAPHLAAALEALLRGACPDGVDGASRALAGAGQLARLRRLIRENLGLATLGPDRLCRMAGVSRSQLYRLFEPLGGVARSIQRERLRCAFRRLADPTEQRSIAAIAEALGMFDPSTFSRAFRQEFGCPPGQVRAAARGGPGAPPPPGPRPRLPEGRSRCCSNSDGPAFRGKTGPSAFSAFRRRCVFRPHTGGRMLRPPVSAFADPRAPGTNLRFTRLRATRRGAPSGARAAQATGPLASNAGRRASARAGFAAAAAPSPYNALRNHTLAWPAGMPSSRPNSA